MSLEITLYENGPIVLSNEHSKLALCRCGQSANKPLCDGSHKGCELPAGKVRVGEHLSIEANLKR